MTSAAILSGSTPISDALSDAAEKLRRATVRVMDRGSSIGSGVIWREDGLVITNAHVATRGRAVIEDSAGHRLDAAVEARDARRDLAALRVNASGLPVLRKAAPSHLRAGDLVMALGNPFGGPGAVVTGIVHAIGPAEHLQHLPWIQADIRLAPGNSGGPLADAECRIAGINTMIVGGLGLAIPADSVEKFLNGKSDQPTIGVSVQPISVQGPRSRILGLWVDEVEAASPAARAGICRSDILIGYGDKPFRRPTDLLVALRSGPPVIALDVLRDNRQISVEVHLNQ